MERFSECRVLCYGVMTNHFHLLLEVPPPPEEGEFGLSEEDLLHRLGGLYSRAYVAGVPGEIAQAVRCRVRYFRDGAVSGSRKFVNDFFASQRERFGEKRKDGARKARGSLKPLAGEIWSLRDLRDG